MPVCELCGSESFEKHAGFLYCLVCQTQSQEYFEQEHEFSQGNAITRVKTRKNEPKQKNVQIHDDGLWTSWEAFNYILFGMTQEIKKICADENFEIMVFQLWAAYLKASNVAFTSMSTELLPKLSFMFKERDARQLYNIDIASHATKSVTSKKSGSISSAVSNTSNSSVYQLRRKKSKLIKSEYEESLSMSMLSTSNLADETLESLGKTSDSEISEKSSVSSQVLVKTLKEMFSKEDYQLFKKVYKSSKLMKTKKRILARKMECITKNKLLAILHLALVLCGSELQLSDLLRFIREGHISFAKVTHFLPFNIKFPKKDYSYIDTKSDGSMPTHLKQRQIICQLARYLKIKSIPTPNLEKLVERYCEDLNLPDEVGNLAKKIIHWMPKTLPPRIKIHPIPSYEAWAMVSIIFVMKLLFGLNNKTEIYLSELAREANRGRNANEKLLFVFEDWQKFIECRKTILAEYHYPIKEQLVGDGYDTENSKMFLDMLTRESKDEHRSQRFIPYRRYYIADNVVASIKQMLRELTQPQNISTYEFQPSLTPQKSYLNEILENLLYKNEKCNSKVKEILQQNFQTCDIEFTYNIGQYSHFVKDKFIVEDLEATFTKGSKNLEQSFDEDILTDCSSKYWILLYPTKVSGCLCNFKEEVFDKTPENFQWLIAECSRMLEMNIRDVYDELLKLEKKLSNL